MVAFGHQRSLLMCLACLLAVAGCESEEITYYPVPDYLLDAGGGGADPDAAGGEEDVFAGAGAGATGASCAAGDQCATGFCLDDDALATAAAELGSTLADAFDVPSGMCGARACADDAACGDGGVCYDMTPFGLPESWCVASCTEHAACRWDEGYTCHGLLAGAETGACLPDSIAAGPPAQVGYTVGGPCVDDAECAAGLCVSNELIASLAPDAGLDIPGGMCSGFCDPDSTGECGPGGICANVQETFGAPFDLCMQLCDSIDDCRWEEGYSCWLADAGQGLQVCLPDALIVAAECDDGHCEQE